jgi:hypothetical protein
MFIYYSGSRKAVAVPTGTREELAEDAEVPVQKKRAYSDPIKPFTNGTPDGKTVKGKVLTNKSMTIPFSLLQPLTTWTL